jgi:hypothetical protein
LPILEAEYRAVTHWAHPIRAAIQANPILAERDRAWRDGALSDLAFAIETRLTYIPRIIVFIDDNIAALTEELHATMVEMHLSRRAAFNFHNKKAVEQLLFGTTAFITESRSCFENIAAFYALFLETYCGRKICKKRSYDVVARSTGKYAWALALQRIRGDLIHARPSLSI